MKQNIYIRGLVQNAEVKQRRSRDSSREPKSKTYKYFLNTSTSSVQVCKKFFLETFQISDARLYKCCSESDATAAIDGRGHRSPGNKIDISDVINHIKSFPCYESHYTRKDNPSRRYLSSNLNIRKMYTLYVEKCEQEKTIPVKEKKYYDVFSNKFNLHFKPPAKDTCQKCDELNNKIKFAVSEEIKKQHATEKEVHLRKAELARSSMNSDKIKADENLYVFTIDLQKALAFPKLSCSTAYYKRNMYMYNFGCHSFNTNTATMYMWDETQGSRGSQELGSCVISHLRKNATKHKEIVMYSDSCTGQNRNIKMSLLLLQLVNDSVMAAETIDHKFLVSGHSYLPNDSDFAIIETKAKKRQYIFGPEDWYDIVKTAKKTNVKKSKSNPFIVTKVTHSDFLSTKSLEDAITKRKVDADHVPVNWLKIQWLRFCKGQPYKVYFKYTLNEEIPFSVINIEKNGKVGKPTNFSKIQNPKLYNEIRAVTQDKKKDMLDLLKFIPPTYHQYYRSLTVNTNTRASSKINNNEDDDIETEFID